MPNGMKSVIYDLLPARLPGITLDELMERIESAGLQHSESAVQKVLHQLRCDNALRSDGRQPSHYWRGPTAAEPKPYYREGPRPWWTRPGPDLLRECHAARDEIRGELKR